MKTRNDNHLQMANQESNINQGGDKMNLKFIFKVLIILLSSFGALSIMLFFIPTPRFLTDNPPPTETPKVDSKNPFKPDQFKTFSGKQARDLAELIRLASYRFDQQEYYKKSVDEINKMLPLPDGYAFIQNLTDNKGKLFGFNQGGDKMNLKFIFKVLIILLSSFGALSIMLFFIPTPRFLTDNPPPTETPKVDSKNPFKPDQFKTFSGKQARDLAELIRLASYRFDQQEYYKKSVDEINKMLPLPDGYAFIQNLTDNKGKLFGFVAQKNRKEEGEEKREAFIIIRGTKTAREGWKDFQSKKGVIYSTLKGKELGKVGKGFYSIYNGGKSNSLRKDIEAALLKLKGKKVAHYFVAGHSLGGALATLTIPDLIDLGIDPSKITVYTFGSPRSVDPKLAKYLNESKVKHWQIANTGDLVPDLPLAHTNLLFTPEGKENHLLIFLFSGLKSKNMTTFQHTGTPVYFTIATESIGNNHNLDKTYMEGIGQLPLEQVKLNGELTNNCK